MSTVVVSRNPVVAATGTRVESIDIIRGAVMVLMAIDHVRVFSGLPAAARPSASSSPGGSPTSARRPSSSWRGPAPSSTAGRAPICRGSLLVRGAWLVLLELTFIRVAWTFNLDFAHYEMAGVIWVIGWCMILMAGLVKLPIAVVGVIGVVIITAHNLLDPYVGTLIPTLQQDAAARSGRSSTWRSSPGRSNSGPTVPT